MKVGDKRYLNQGIHVITSIFTVEKGVFKVLLIKRKNDPYKDRWSLVGGSLYNDEDLEDGVKREIKEKTGIENMDIYLCNVFGKKSRSPWMRMVAILYIGIIDSEKVKILRETQKTINSAWVSIDDLPDLAYDHNEIIKEALSMLKQKVASSNILEALFPNGFTIPEIQKVYESILNKKFDRRNFRRRLLSLNLVQDTGESVKFEGKKPAKLYTFKSKIDGKLEF